jgi:hypothetical protein
MLRLEPKWLRMPLPLPFDKAKIALEIALVVSQFPAAVLFMHSACNVHNKGTPSLHTAGATVDWSTVISFMWMSS